MTVSAVVAKNIIDALGKRLDDDTTYAFLYGMPIVQSQYLPKGTVLIANTRPFPTLEKSFMDYTSRKYPPISTSTTMRVEVYGGPHHGRILVIPAKSPRFITLPAQMPAGEMFREGRTSQAEWAGLKEVTYELTSRLSVGGQYLGYVEGKARDFSFTVPPVPSLRISANGIDLVRSLRNAAFNYGSPGNSNYDALTAREKSLVEYISKLETTANIYRGQTVRY